MTKYKKIINNFITEVGTSNTVLDENSVAINDEEYEKIVAQLNNIPKEKPKNHYQYKLSDNLEWMIQPIE